MSRAYRLPLCRGPCRAHPCCCCCWRPQLQHLPQHPLDSALLTLLHLWWPCLGPYPCQRPCPCLLVLLLLEA